MRTSAAPWLAMLVAALAACDARGPSTEPPPSLSEQIESGIDRHAEGLREDGVRAGAQDVEEAAP
jgi:predicted small lipoprotein YifL